MRWVLQHGRIAGLGTDTVPGARVLCVPLRSGSSVLGVLALAPRSQSTSSHRERSVLDAFVQQGALALERARLSEEAKAAVLKARTEEMRSSLLSAVSHDLRTPLAAITGAASALRDPGGGLDADQRADLVITIGEEAERLERLVANLLDMTRLESGALVVKRDWVPLEEIVGAAATRLEAKLRGRTVSVSLPLDLPLLSVDPVLLEQVFVNLLENAVRHTPPGSPIDVAARRDDEAVVVEVSDRGPGIPSGDEERVFEKFYRGPAAPGGGVGLGLAICRGIAEAHGGTLKAEARPGGGSTFRLRLPLEKGAPVVPSDGEIEARTETPG
ncbi:MAG: hypothetical protein HUU19_12780 [Phycisphaerales bacterium]|nr:hypothetical protein [Phycisphaerales bacterium]